MSKINKRSYSDGENLNEKIIKSNNNAEDIHEEKHLKFSQDTVDKKSDKKQTSNEKLQNTLKKKIERKKKTISQLIRQSNEIKSYYKPGRFEEILNGPRGPTVRLHRHSVFVGLFKLFLLTFFTAGIVLVSVITLCITINVGYVCVQIDDINFIIQMLFYVFYTNALFKIIGSFWRTYLRLIHTILDIRFGASVYDIFIKRVLGYFVSQKIALKTMPDKYKLNPNEWYEKINLIVFIIFVFIILLPFPLIAIFYGYWKVSGMICLTFVCGGAITIIGLNFFCRFVLYTKFFRRLDEYYYNAPFFVDLTERYVNQTKYLRLIYCTTNGLEGGVNYLYYCLNSLINMLLQMAIASVIFGSFDPDIGRFALTFEILFGLIVIRFSVPIYKKLYKLCVKLKIVSGKEMEKKEKENEEKLNAEMEATHKKYLDEKRNSTIINLKRRSMNPTLNLELGNLSDDENKKNTIFSYNINNDDKIIENNSNNGNTNNCITIDVLNVNDPNNNNNNNNDNDNDINNNNNDNDNDINSNNDDDGDDEDSNSNDDYNNKNKFHIINVSYYPKKISTYRKASSTSNVLSNDKRDSKDNKDINIKAKSNKRLSLPLLSKVDQKHDSRFYKLLNSKNRNLHHKVIIAWDINKLISPKGCVVVFLKRLLKNSIGVSFMAYLNYHRYSVNSSSETTNNNLLVDIISHILFLTFLLGQDIIYLIPASYTKISMKARKIYFMILLVLEFSLVTAMRIIITFNYIPMAFILIAYANFKVHPDPRYTWDDESVHHKTFFDLFKPSLDIYFDIPKEFSKSSKSNRNKEKRNFDNSSANNRIDKVSVDASSYSAFKNSLLDIDKYNKKNSFDHSTDSVGRNIIDFDYLQSLSNPDIHSDDENLTNEEQNIARTISNIKHEVRYRRNTRARYNSMSVLFVTFSIVIISVFLSLFLSKKPKENFHNRNNVFNGLQKPAICQWRVDGISINEFSSLAFACYYNSLDDIIHSYSFSRPETSMNNFTIGDNSLDSKSGVHYVDFVHEEKNLIIVAIRGTSSIEDIFQDLYIWSASFFLQISSNFGTFTKFWPTETIASLVNFIVKQFTNFQLLYWKDVEKHIVDIQENTNFTIYLTGHSLGGGIAGVISAHLNVPAITFSSPGLGYSYKTYDIELKKLIHNFVNVIPITDPVPQLDLQVGQIQNIECNSGQPLTCHGIKNTIDTLNEMCGEKSIYRYWDETEEKMINGKPVTYRFKEKN